MQNTTKRTDSDFSIGSAIIRNPKAVTDEGKAPRYWVTLLKAARLIEAQSHYDESSNEYHVDAHAMAHLCGALGNRKLETLKA